MIIVRPRRAKFAHRVSVWRDMVELVAIVLAGAARSSERPQPSPSSDSFMMRKPTFRVT